MTKDAVDVLPQGLDPNVVTGGVDLGNVRRPLPVEKALDDVLLAYEMNGTRLPVDHGFPVRLVVPGWVGIASIKWLGQIEVSTRPLFSLEHDVVPHVRLRLPERLPAAHEPTGQERAGLARGAVLPLGMRMTLTGRAWSGSAAIRGVEISADRGATWAAAKSHGANRPGAWARWRFELEPRSPGEHEPLDARDGRGRADAALVRSSFNTFGDRRSSATRRRRLGCRV